MLTLIQEMLPHISALNQISGMGTSQVSQDSNEPQSHGIAPVTTSHHYTWLESDHPYKPATVSHYRVTFSESVRWLSIEFTPDCGTAQPEDYLQLYVPSGVVNPPITTAGSVQIQDPRSEQCHSSEYETSLCRMNS